MLETSIHEIQIIEGLFLADWVKIRSVFFMRNNQVSMIIKSSYSKKPFYVSDKIKILEFDWPIDEIKFSPIILRQKCQILVNELNNAIQKCKCVLICDDGLTSQSIIICCVILMTKFNWNLLKTLQYMNSKIPKLNLLSSQTICLRLYDKYLNVQPCQQSICLWNKSKQISEEAILVRNTFLNSNNVKTKRFENQGSSRTQSMKRKRVSFSLSKCQYSLATPQDYTKFSYYNKNEQNVTIKQENDFEPQPPKYIYMRERPSSCLKKAQKQVNTEYESKLDIARCAKKILRRREKLEQKGEYKNIRKTYQIEIQMNPKLEKLRRIETKMNQIFRRRTFLLKRDFGWDKQKANDNFSATRDKQNFRKRINTVH